MEIRHIKLYPKLCIRGKTKTEEEAKIEVKKMTESKDVGQWGVQQVKYEISKNDKRKTYQYDWEVSYYRWETIKEMAEDKINEMRKE